MKAINYHVRGIITSLTNLFQGKYVLFFVPGLILAGLFWFYQSKFADASFTTGYSWLSWIDASVTWLLSAADFLVEQLYIFMVLTVLSPFFTALGEKYDKQLTGKVTDGGILRFINDFFRMIFVVIISLLLELIFIGIYLLISKIFGFSEMTDTISYYCIAAFFYGFAFYDFALERYAKGVGSSLGFAFSAPLGMIILGSIFQSIYMIPYVGIPLAPVLAVMISTVAYAYYTKQLPQSKQLSNE